MFVLLLSLLQLGLQVSSTMLVFFYFLKKRIQVFHCGQLTSPKLSVQQAQIVTVSLRSKKIEYLKSTPGVQYRGGVQVLRDFLLFHYLSSPAPLGQNALVVRGWMLGHTDVDFPHLCYCFAKKLTVYLEVRSLTRIVLFGICY